MADRLYVAERLSAIRCDRRRGRAGRGDGCPWAGEGRRERAPAGAAAIKAAFAAPVAYMVWRDRFDQALCLSAAAAGAELRDGGTVRAVRQVDSRVEVDVNGEREA